MTEDEEKKALELLASVMPKPQKMKPKFEVTIKCNQCGSVDCEERPVDVAGYMDDGTYYLCNNCGLSTYGYEEEMPYDDGR